MSNEYEIRTVADFAKLPADKIAACLSDFVEWLDAVRKIAAFPSVVSDMLGCKKGAVSVNMSSFTWIDDGNAGLTAFRLIDPQGGEIGRIALTGGCEVAK